MRGSLTLRNLPLYKKTTVFVHLESEKIEQEHGTMTLLQLPSSYMLFSIKDGPLSKYKKFVTQFVAISNNHNKKNSCFRKDWPNWLV